MELNNYVITWYAISVLYYKRVVPGWGNKGNNLIMSALVFGTQDQV